MELKKQDCIWEPRQNCSERKICPFSIFSISDHRSKMNDKFYCILFSQYDFYTAM